MSMNKADRDYYIVSEIREACIKNNWFYCGTNEQYEAMFEKAKTAKTDEEIEAVCNDIYIYSDVQSFEEDMEKITNIEKTVKRIIKTAYKTYPEQASKEEERKALDKIKKIVHSLGDDSYVGTAFEGCFEIAEENINNDWACSMKQRYDSALKEGFKVLDECKELKKELAEAYENLTIAGDSNLAIQKERDSYKARYEEVLAREQDEVQTATGLIDEKAKLSSENEALKAEIVQLKAKLYDMMMKEGEC